MKHPYIYRSLAALAALTLVTAELACAQETESRHPLLDGEGRFWIYRNGPTHPQMPFTPYGWMSDSTNLTHLIQVDLDHRDRPNAFFRVQGTPEKECCIKMKITWDDATWASIAFISGPAKPAWWGETKGGKYYDLDSLTKKKLVFF